MKVVAYLRVSTDNQQESGLGLSDQEQKIIGYCKLYDLELVKIIKEAASGRSLDRPGLQEALNMLEKGEAEGLIVAKLDRLTRSVRDMGILLDKYFATKYAFFVVTEKIDTFSASGRLLLRLMASIAEWERETIAERTSSALSQKRKRGERTGGSLCYGWNQVGNKLVENPQEQSVISQIRTLRKDGCTYQGIADRLNASGIMSKQQKKWDGARVFRLLNKNKMLLSNAFHGAQSDCR